MPKQNSEMPLAGGDANVGESALSPECVVRVTVTRDVASERAEIERMLANGATRVFVTNDPTLSGAELAASLAEVGLTLEVDRPTAVLFVRGHSACKRTRTVCSDVW